MAANETTPRIISRQEAIKQGFSHYFTGKPCKRGHLSKRTVKDCTCLGCHAFYTRRYTNENLEKTKASQAASHVKYKARKNEISRQYYHDNVEKEKERKKKWYAANRERMRAKCRVWRRRNPLKVNVIYNSNRRARRKGNGGSHTAQDILDIFNAQNGKCAYCRTKLAEKYQVDHITPLTLGGSNDRRNLQLLCGGCNLAKHGNDPLDHARSLGLLL